MMLYISEKLLTLDLPRIKGQGTPDNTLNLIITGAIKIKNLTFNSIRFYLYSAFYN